MFDYKRLQTEAFKIVDYTFLKERSKKNQKKGTCYIANTLKQIHLLLGCYQISGDNNYLELIHEYSKEVYKYQTSYPTNLSFENGGGGIAYLFIKIHEEIGDNTYLTKASEIITSAAMQFLNSKHVGDSLFLGRSGVVLILLYLYDKTSNNNLLELLDAYSKKSSTTQLP